MRANSFPVISVDDEAIDTESMTLDEMIEYCKTRDIKLLERFRVPGQPPTVYRIRAVPAALWETYVCAGGDHDAIKFRRAFMCGIESVENLRGKDGVAVLEWKPTRPIHGTQLCMLTDEECNENFSRAEVLEIGSVIYAHSFLALRKGLIWQLPPTLFELLASRKFRRVESVQSIAQTQTSAQHSVAATQAPTVTENTHA